MKTAIRVLYLIISKSLSRWFYYFLRKNYHRFKYGYYFPDDIPGLTCWIDLSDPSTVKTDEDGMIVVIEDKSGHGNDFYGGGAVWHINPYNVEMVAAYDRSLSEDEVAEIKKFMDGDTQKDRRR